MDALPLLDRRFLAQDPHEEAGRTEANMVGARGCPYNCSFCGAAVSANPDITIRTRNPQGILTEMHTLRDADGVTAFRFVDDLFLGHRRVIDQMMTAFAGARVGEWARWDATGRINVPALRPDEPQPPRPEDTPPEVEVRWRAPMPIIANRADLDLPLPDDAVVRGGECRHRLVTVGDSLTQGFKSGAIAEPERSWPMIVAHELGLRATYDPGAPAKNPEFTYPTFPGPQSAPGLPFNLEALLRAGEQGVGGNTLREHEFEYGHAVERMLREIAKYWEHGDGATGLPPSDQYHHNLAVWGHDIRDALSKSGAWCAAAMHPDDHGAKFLDEIRKQIERHLVDDFVVSYPGERTTIRTLWGPKPDASQLTAAKSIGDDGGIETLVVALGANNALGAVLKLKVNWSQGDFADLKQKDHYTVWNPVHFEQEFAALVEAVSAIDAKHVIWATVPHVTVVPLARGVGEKPYYSRYFPRYTRPWISDDEFDASLNGHLTGDEARVIDAAIDQYNYTIKRFVRAARTATGICSTCAACSTGWPTSATSTARAPSRTGSPSICCRPRCGRCRRDRTPGSSAPTSRDGSPAA